MKKSIFVNYQHPPPPSPPLQHSVGDEERTTVRLPHVRPSHIWLCHANCPWRLGARTDLETAGLRRRRGRRARSRSWRRCRRSWRDRDQCSQSAWGSQAGSPACPRVPCRPSPWSAPRAPCPGGRGSSCQTGPAPRWDLSDLGEGGGYLLWSFITFYDFLITMERRIAGLNCQYLWEGGNVILK